MTSRPTSHFEEHIDDHSEDALLVAQQRDITLGLTWEEVAAIQRRDGKNVISLEKPPTWYGTLFGAIIHPFNFVLTALAIVAISTMDYSTFGVMMLMVVLSVILRFWQEMKASSEAEVN
jgi:Mg2+-importing ATPase